MEAAHWADDLTPRDTDPFSRSSLGWLVNPEFELTKDALIVTAVSSDSRRKLVSVLQSAGRKVLALDVPPSNDSPNSAGFYKEQLVLLAEKIAKHTGKRFTGRVLRRAVKKVASARSARRRFLMTAESVTATTATARKTALRTAYGRQSLTKLSTVKSAMSRNRRRSFMKTSTARLGNG